MAGKKPKQRLVRINLGATEKSMPLGQALGLIADASKAQHWPRLIAFCEQVLGQVPGAEEARVALYRALAQTEQYSTLLEHCEARLKDAPRDILSLEYSAHALRQTGRDPEALPRLIKAVELARTNTRLLNALGTLYKELGDFAKAMECFERVTIIRPSLGKAWWNRSDLVTDDAREIDSLNKQLNRHPPGSKERHYLHFALYRAYERIGEYDAAYGHLVQGNALKKALLGYRVEENLDNDRRIVEFFTSTFDELKHKVDAAAYSAEPARPIFIVGMPRTGSSLVEQILASHPQVTGGGEIPLLPRATEITLRRGAFTTAFPDCLKAFTSQGFAQLGELYQQMAGALAHGNSVLTDKYLLNYKAIPLIRLSLPQAKIIHIRRNALDVCFGCYRQLFTEGLGFCYDLGDLAATWHSHEGMMKAWAALEDQAFLSIAYEDLVTDTESSIDRLLDYCELPPATQCHRFYETRRSIKTASNTQVRQPIFNTGMGRWEPYRKHLQALEASLEAAENNPV